ncbi:MAG: hypothetical protein IPK82_11455 [Polyangiaceae bacterium]|nr:hypothetical protein [Polyangiaceae bacterium]
MEILQAELEKLSDDGKPPMAWARFLEVAPPLSKLPLDERLDRLEKLGIEHEQWSRAEKYWIVTFALDLAQGKTARAEEYGRRCAEQKSNEPGLPSELTPDTAPQVDREPTDPEPFPAGLTAPASGVQPPISDVRPAAPAPVAVPSFLRESPRQQAPARAWAPPPTATVIAEKTQQSMPANRAPVVPFGAQQSPEFAARLAGPAIRHQPAPPKPMADMTQLPIADAAKPALPFAGTDMTMEQHAELSAELSAGVDATQRAALFAQYGITSPMALATLSAQWQARLNADPDLTKRWQAHYKQHRDKMRERATRK